MSSYTKVGHPMDKIHCDSCNVDISRSGLSRHVKTQKHISKSAPGNIAANPAPSTEKSRDNAKKHIDKLLSMNKNPTPEEMYKFLQGEKLANSTIHKTIRQGYLVHYHKELDRKTINKYEVFLRDLKDDIQRESDNKDIDVPTIAHLLKSPKLPGWIRLYLHMPLRIESFTKLKILKNGTDEEINHINLSTGKLHTYKNKMNDYDEIKLTPETLAIASEIMGEKIPQLRTATRHLQSYTGTNSQLIRRAFAEQTPDKVYAARLLGHTYNTHLGTYIRH
jgi:hypothetical protein